MKINRLRHETGGEVGRRLRRRPESNVDGGRDACSRQREHGSEQSPSALPATSLSEHSRERLEHAAAAERETERRCSLQDEAILRSIIIEGNIDRDAPDDLHVQVAAEIRRAIAEGEARQGERLPPARDIAAVLGVNANTVLRALRALRDEGLLEFRRGRSVTVVGTSDRSLVITRARELLDLARTHGYKRRELVALIETLD